MTTPSGPVRRGAALACLAAYGFLAIRYAGPPDRQERALFARINSGGEQPWLRVPQQWGTPWTLPAVAVVAVGRRRWRVAATALACLPAEKAIETATKKWRGRPRPVYVQPTVLRDDAPVEGGSMPSGHAAIASCAAVLLWPMVPWPVTALSITATALSGYVRVHQGAHEPTDVVAGLFLGTGLALATTEVVEASWTGLSH